VLHFLVQGVTLCRKLLIYNVTVQNPKRNIRTTRKNDSQNNRAYTNRMTNIDMIIETNIVELGLELGDVAAKQIPFATALALTRTALDARDAAKRQLDDDLTIRSKWIFSGIQINKAVKRDWPHTASEVGIAENRAFLIDHIIGNSRRKSRKGSRVAIPNTGEIKRTTTGRIPKAKHVSSLKSKTNRKAFTITSGKTGRKILVRRETKGRYPLKFLYAFESHVSIEARKFRFIEAVTKEAGRVYDKNFGRALAKALATAR